MAELCFATTTLLISGCNKIDWDDLFHHPDKVDKLCDIKKITATSYGVTRTAKFSYNNWGDPVDVDIDKISTGYPEFRFLYNKNRQLTELIGAYSGDLYESWHRYVYQNGRIVKDTLRIFGEYPNYNNYALLRVVTYEYDNSNRIIKMTDFQINPYAFQPQIQTFTYNADGNLEKVAYYKSPTDSSPSIYTYTYNKSKPSIFRTNKMWMFVNRDYSVNARINAVTYNQYGLPTKLSGGTQFIFLDGLDIGNSDIEYQCK